MPTLAVPTDGFAAYGRHVNPALGRFLALSGRDQRFVRAEGNRLETDRGDVYTDWLAGFGSLNLGHNPPRILEALKAHMVDGAPNLYMESLNPYAGELAQRLVRAAGCSFGTCFFCNSGAEAVEAALKLAMAAAGRRGVVHCAGAYHGTTLGALSMMASGVYRDRFEPLLPDFHVVPFNDLPALEKVLEERRPAAFMAEPIQMESGVRVPDPGYLRRAAELCRRRGTLFVLDEVQTGLGRTGPLFSFQDEEAAPDVLALAKSLGGGVVPLGAIVIREGLFEKAYGDHESSEIHNSTFGGNALACRAGIEALSILEAPGFLEGVRERSCFLEGLLKTRLGGHPRVSGIALKGFLGGIRLKDLDHPWFSWAGLGVEALEGRPTAGPLLVHRLYRRKLLVQVCGHDWNTVRIEPPLTVSAEDCARFVDILKEELDWIHANA